MADRLDVGALVCTAALVLDTEPGAVLDRADLAALEALVTEIDAVDDPVRAAAHLLERIVVDRPFVGGSAAIGWLAAVDLLRARDRHVAAPATEVVALCAAVRAGTADVVGALRRWAVAAGPSCPTCGRTVYAFDPSAPAVLHGRSKTELVARCAFEHRAHDRRGRHRPSERPQAAPPEVVARGSCGTVAVAVDGRTLLYSPYCDDPVIFRVSEVDHVAPSDLVGRWDALVARATTVAFVPADELDVLR